MPIKHSGGSRRARGALWGITLLLALGVVLPGAAQDEESAAEVVEEEAEEATLDVLEAAAPATLPPGVLFLDSFDDDALARLPTSSPDPDRYLRGYLEGEYLL